MNHFSDKVLQNLEKLWKNSQDFVHAFKKHDEQTMKKLIENIHLPFTLIDFSHQHGISINELLIYRDAHRIKYPEGWQALEETYSIAHSIILNNEPLKWSILIHCSSLNRFNHILWKEEKLSTLIDFFNTYPERLDNYTIEEKRGIIWSAARREDTQTLTYVLDTLNYKAFAFNQESLDSDYVFLSDYDMAFNNFKRLWQLFLKIPYHIEDTEKLEKKLFSVIYDYVFMEDNHVNYFLTNKAMDKMNLLGLWLIENYPHIYPDEESLFAQIAKQKMTEMQKNSEEKDYIYSLKKCLIPFFNKYPEQIMETMDSFPDNSMLKSIVLHMNLSNNLSVKNNFSSKKLKI